MNIKNSIFHKIFFLLFLIAGWGSSAYADRFMPEFEITMSRSSDHWYQMFFANTGGQYGYVYLNGADQRLLRTQNQTQGSTENYYWQFLGTSDNFKLVNFEGYYARWDGTRYVGTLNEDQASTFSLVANTNGSGDCWGIQRIGGQYWNPQSQEGQYQIREWRNNDGGARVRFSAISASALEEAREKYDPTYLNNVNLLFQDRDGASLTGVSVIYTPISGESVELSSAMSSYDFGNVSYSARLFAPKDDIMFLDVDYSKETNTLIFTLYLNPNALRYSSEPSATGWSADTHWYTIQNNRSNQSGHNYKYLSTAASSVNDNCTLKASIAALENNRGEAWAFVGSEEGIQIYNAAYGPDFVLGSSSSGDNPNANFKMVLKDNPEGYITTFSVVSNRVLKAPSQNSYAFRVGKTGNVHIHVTNGALRTWNNGDAIVGSNNDGGSSFTLTAIEDEVFNALPSYDVYQAAWTGTSTSNFNITYNHSSNTFGRRGSVADGAFFIVKHDSPIALEDFSTTISDEYELSSVTIKEDPEHTFRILNFFIKDAKATEEWVVRINDGCLVNYLGVEYADGNSIFLRPDVTPQTIDFTVSAPDNKFIWGPLINAKDKTITYDVRDLATDLATGWYQLQISDNAATISSLASQIRPKEGNINTPANTLYLVPSVYEPGDNRLFKVTGVPTYASEAATFVYIRDNGFGSYAFVHPASGQQFSAYGFSFANGHLTKSSGLSFESTAHPLEGPYLLASGSQGVSFKVSPANLSDYDVYQVNIVGSGDISDVRLNLNSANILGNKIVSSTGFVFVKKGSVLVRSQFEVYAGNVTITSFSIGEKSTDGITPITIGVTPRLSQWTIHLTGDAKRAEDRVIYNSQNYSDGDMIGVTYGTIPTALDIMTNVTDRFVWGPVINDKDFTVSFEIKTPVEVKATSNNLFTTDGWYQFMLVPYTTKGANFINTINQVAIGAKSRKGSYIYMFNAEKEFEQNASNHYPMKFSAVTASGDQATSFFYVKANGRTPQFQTLNGHYVHNSGFMSTIPANMQGMDAINNSDIYGQNIYGVYRWSNYNDTGAERPFVGASGTNLNYYIRAVKVNPFDKYDVYQVRLSDIGQNMVRYTGKDNQGVNELYNNGYLMLTKGVPAPNKDEFYFDGITKIEGITITDNSGIKVITFTISSRAAGYTNTIIHRQHDVYDQIAFVDDNLLPKGNHIKRGGGMIEHPMQDKFTSINTENDRQIQNTSVFRVTQYTKPGTSTECVLPHTKEKSSSNHVNQYQRWYNYQTERPLENGILVLSNFYQFANGHCNYNSSGTRLRDVMGSANITLPTGSDEIYVGVDASEFQDAKAINGNLLEPSLNMRVIYHIVNAHKMAAALTTSGDKWWEEKEFFVPNIKRGSDNYKNNADLIPLDMPFSNYWIYKVSGNTDDNNLMPIVPESGNYNTLRNNIEIVVEGTATDNRPMKEYLEVGVFDGNPGNIGSAPYINSNHFIYYKVKGNGVTRTIPAGSQAVIKVYAKDGSNNSSAKYQLFKFILNFQSGTEPLAISSVVGNSVSTRSIDYFIKNGFKESASLTFMNKDIPFTRIPNHRNDGNEDITYAFPIDFSRTSYGYSPSNTYGNYRITTMGYGIQYRPVSLYEQNIKNRTNTPMKSADDYFFYIDAAESPGQVASLTLDGSLCVGSRLYCYGWFGSSNYYDGDGKPSGASVLLQVVGRRSNGTEEVIASYLPGTLTDVSYDDEGNAIRSLSYASFPSQQQAGWRNLNSTQVGVWNSVGFSFVVKDIAFVSYDLRIINNCFSTSGGDYVLDDFRVFVSPPKGNVDFTTPLCSDALRHVKVHTDYDALIESSGINTSVPGAKIPVSFCFLNKNIYDEATKDYYDVDAEGKRTLKEGIDYDSAPVKAVFNEAFGNALIGERTIVKEVKGHAFHNFTVPVDYKSIPTYAYNDSPDDQIFKEEKDNGERRVVFKEMLYQSDGSEHQWEPGHSYYLLFSPYHVSDEDVQQREVGTKVFHIADLCCVLTTFSIMPPIEVKGDATVTSSDHVKACDNQIITFKVDMPALKLNDDDTAVTDAVISGLNYDWWIGTSKLDATHSGFLKAKFGTYADIEDARRYNHKSVDDYPDPADVDRNVYLESALENIRFYYPYARTLDEVELTPYDNANGYGIVAEHLACVAHFLQPLSDGRRPLSLFGQTFNLKVSHAETDANSMQHFVAIPILPEQEYGVDEKLIYCPCPQELIIEVGPTAPNMQDGFGAMTYPDHIVNVPIRIGKQQIDGVRKNAEALEAGYTLNIPLRKIIVTGSQSTELIAKDHDTEPFGSIFLTATDDKHYSFDTEGGEFVMRRVAQVIDIHAPKGGAIDEAYMKIAFTHDFAIHEGCTYTLKLPYVEDKECECEGTLVFDLKVVPEYQVWTAGADNSDWTNDKNWARADRSELYADNDAMGDAITNATELTTAASYPDNETNKTAKSFVPMYFTNVLLGQNTVIPQLYGGLTPATSTAFLTGLNTTATEDIVYEMEVTPMEEANRQNYVYDCDFTCEPFGTYVANGLTFQPGARMMNAERLQYHKAWVEYLLDVNRWYTLSSPLQDTYAGEWYAPTGDDADNAAKQLTPHFYDINYNQTDCDRFRPAIYQRSWDSDSNRTHAWMKDGSDCNAYITDDWSYVYNDVLQRYGAGGFSVKVSDAHMDVAPGDEQALIRMPKADLRYTYYDIDGDTGQKADDLLPAMPARSRLWSDKLASAASFQQTITNVVATNNFFLVGNPFMTNLDMDEFFRLNPQFEKAYWVLTEGGQTISVRAAYDNKDKAGVAEDERWTLTQGSDDFSADAAVVAPLQGFFVKATASTNTTTVNYTASMQSLKEPLLKPLRSPLRPTLDENDEDESAIEELAGQISAYTMEGRRVTLDSKTNSATSRRNIYIMRGAAKKVLR